MSPFSVEATRNLASSLLQRNVMWCAIDDIVSGGSRRSWAVNNKMTIHHENQNHKSYLGYVLTINMKKLEILVENQLIRAILLGKVQKNVGCNLR